MKGTAADGSMAQLIEIVKSSRVSNIEDVGTSRLNARNNELQPDVVLTRLSNNLLIDSGLSLQVGWQRSTASAKGDKILPEGCTNQIFLYGFFPKRFIFRLQLRCDH